MRFLTLAQVTFLALLCLYVAIKSDDYSENVWQARQLKHRWADKVEGADFHRLANLERELLDAVCEHWLKTLDGWRLRSARAGDLKGYIDIGDFRREMSEKGIDMLAAAYDECIKDGMSRIGVSGSQSEAVNAELDRLFNYYLRIVNLAIQDRVDFEQFNYTLDMLIRERKTL